MLTISFLVTGFVAMAQVKNDVLSQVDALLFDSRYAEAIQKIDQQANVNVDTQIRLMNKKAEALIGLGKYEDADKILQEAIGKCKDSKNNEVLKAITQSSLGYLHLNQGRFDQALEHLTAASATLQERGSPLETAQALTNLGSTYNSTGKYLQAEEQFQMA